MWHLEEVFVFIPKSYVTGRTKILQLLVILATLEIHVMGEISFFDILIIKSSSGWSYRFQSEL